MENKNTGLIILIVVLSLLVLGLGGFILYDKVLNTSNEIVNNDSQVADSKENENKNTENIKDKIDNENIVVNDFTYNKVVNTVHRGLIGKYISTETKDTYFEINEKGEVNLSIEGCSGIEKYNNGDVEFKYFYQKPNEGISTIHILISSKIGSPYTIHQFTVNLEYNVEKNTFENFTSNPVGCSSNHFMKYNKQ